MPKVVSRSAISTSEDKQALHSTSRLIVHYCLCGEFILVIDKPLNLLPRRPIDGTYIIRNISPKRSYKLNTQLNQTPILMKRDEGFEKQWRFNCFRCGLMIGYETKLEKDSFTYILPGALTEIQSSLPSDALDLDPAQTLKEQVLKKQLEKEDAREKNSTLKPMEE